MINAVYTDALYAKNILVKEGTDKCEDKDIALIVALLADRYSISIKKGEELLDAQIFGFLESKFGWKNVPESFYVGFPQSVKMLDKESLLVDQIVHYVTTYGLGNFDEAGHSLLEAEVARTTLGENEGFEKRFSIFTEEEALDEIKSMVENYISSTRPLSDGNYTLVHYAYMDDSLKGIDFSKASRNTAIRLLIDTRNVQFAKIIPIYEFPKFVDELWYRDRKNAGHKDIKNLNLCNQDRKFVASVLTMMLKNVNPRGMADALISCFEKRKSWVGILHHIHYVPVGERAETFVKLLRDKNTGNISVSSRVERYIDKGSILEAATILKNNKGSNAVIRNLNYLLSRCSDEEVEPILDLIGDGSLIVAIQLYFDYNKVSSPSKTKIYAFTKHNKSKHHVRTPDEESRCKTVLSAERKALVSKALISIIDKKMAGRVKGKVYVDDDMRNIALPLFESAGQTGFGILPSGSIVPIGSDTKIRAFTYWEKVDDIDLSIIGLNADGTESEFSWRSMYNRQNDAITYSGDQTSGFNGGSEYFDMDLAVIRDKYPNTKYLVVCNNMYSDATFADCLCKAGFMFRKDLDAGEVYEPKTVGTSYDINKPVTFEYLYAIDLDRNCIIWLNLAQDSCVRVSGTTSADVLYKYFNLASTFNIRDFFMVAADEVVGSADDADIIISDKLDGDNVIHSYDIDKLIAYLN